MRLRATLMYLRVPYSDDLGNLGREYIYVCFDRKATFRVPCLYLFQSLYNQLPWRAIGGPCIVTGMTPNKRINSDTYSQSSLPFSSYALPVKYRTISFSW